MPKTKTKKMECTLSIKFDAELLRALEQIANDNSIPRSALIRMVLKAYVKKKGQKTIKLSGE